MLRRHFLQGLVVTVMAAACGDDDDTGETPASGGTSTPEQSNKVFPQGLASGDPQPTSVILWTRVEPSAAGGAASIEVSYTVATDEALTKVVASDKLTASLDADHTVHLKVEGLSPSTTYYYRFSAAGVTTQVGRTRTAPGPEEDRPVTLAFASCQDYVGRRYHAWQALLDEKQDLDFVLFLGDYIYESAGDPSFQTPDPERSVALPEGLTIGDGASAYKVAQSVADYRYLYKLYRSDPTLREVHRLYPFIMVWDDHEFANDCWQDRANDFNGAKGDEQSTARRQAANQAWAEFQPADVARMAGVAFPGDLKIYRTLRYGKHVEVIITDQRQYRADHLIPEGPTDDSVGKFAMNSGLGSRNFVLKKGFDTKEAAAKPTMLGAEQKAWFLGAVQASTATWKLWANEVQLWQMSLDLSTFSMLPQQYRDFFYFTTDQWDGYRSERAEILTALAGVNNLVALTGDIHGFFAAELHPDFDKPGPQAVAVEYVVAGISSQTVQGLAHSAIDGNDILKALGLLDLVPQLDDVLKKTNSFLRHSDSNGNGVALATISADAFEVTFLRSGDPQAKDNPGVTTRTKLRTAAGSKAVTPA